MRAAVISITERGRKLSADIVRKTGLVETERFCFIKHCDSSARGFENLSVLAAEVFDRFDALIFVCACGIAVRAVAPHIKSKTTDPAVVVIDDCGMFVIPVLSGHIGGANALAERLAEAIGAQAAITTATDVGGCFSPDSFAAANGLIIADMDAAKAAASAVLDGEMVGFASEYEYDGLPNELSAGTDCRIGIYVGYNENRPFPVTLHLVPKNIVLGIGCRRGTACEAIESAVVSALEKADIPIGRVSAVATADIKADEQGLLAFCEKYGFKFSVYPAQELMEVEGDFTASDFVRAVTGTDNVCERSAVKCSGGRLVLRKTAANGVTVAAAEKPVKLDFERKVL